METCCLKEVILPYEFWEKTHHLTVIMKKCVTIGTAKFTRLQYTFQNRPKKKQSNVSLLYNSFKNKSTTKRGKKRVFCSLHT